MFRNLELSCRCKSLLWPRIFAVVASVCIALPAYAAALEEIVVTATKREERLQDVPISVTAFSSKMIHDLGFTNSYDIAKHVPNMQFMAEASPSIPFIFLRGIGNTSFYATSINPVAIYVDQAYVGQSFVQGLQLFDLQRIEVLRGPQGTLFGRNATAGLVNFITRKPSVDAGVNGRLELTAGDYGQFDVQAAGGAPLGKDAAVRIALFQQTGSGPYHMVTPSVGDKSFGNIDTTGVRGQISWQPTSNLKMLLNLHYGRDHSDTSAEKPGYIISPYGVPNCPAGAVSGALFNGCSDPFGLGLTVDPKFYDVQFSYAPYQKIKHWGTSFKLTWDLGNYTITSLTAWDKAKRTVLEDDDANRLVILNDTFLDNADWLSQELRLTTNFSGNLNGIAGLYYYSDNLHNNLNFAAADLPPPPGIPFPLGLAQDLRQSTTSWALFGEATWNFHPEWSLRLGLRFTDERLKDGINSFAFIANMVRLGAPIPVSDVRAAFAFPLIPQTNLNKNWTNLSGRAAIDWKFAPDQMLYVSASRGFKGGEFNGGALFSTTEVTIAGPETLDDYEIGYKGTLLQGRLQTDLTGFYMQYNNQQVLISNHTPFGLLPNLQNAGASEIKGFEFDLTMQPTDSWYFQFGGGYLDARFTKFIDPALGVNRSGNQLPFAPSWDMNGIVRYQRPIYNGMFALQLDGWWLGKEFFTVENTPALREGAHGLLNARASYSFWNDKVELALFVKNLTAEKFVTTGFDTASAGFGANVFVLNRPRTFGGQVILKYN